MKHTKRALFLTLTMVLSMLLAACGNGQQEEDVASTAAEASVTETGVAEDTSTAADVDEEIDEDDGLGTLYIYVECYDDLTMYDDDVFELTIQNAETEEETTYTISALDETARENGYTVEVAGYILSSLEYLGNNDEILQRGYGINRIVWVYDGEDESAVWIIYVGESGIEELLSYAPSAYVIDDEHDENGESIYKKDKYGNVYIETTDEDGNYIIEYVDEIEP